MPKLLKIFLLLLMLRACRKHPVPAEEDIDPLNPASDYMVIFGDIQSYTLSDYNFRWYDASLSWVEERHRRHGNIACILETGDVTEHNQQFEWKLFADRTAKTAALVPYFACTGNHDYDWDYQGYIRGREGTWFSDYTAFPESRERVLSYFEEGKMDNIIVRNEVQGHRLDVMILEFGPREEVRAWASDWLEEHPDIDFILMTHEFLKRDGSRVSDAESYGYRLFKETTSCGPETLWAEIVKPYDNVRCVLCGHNGFSAFRTDPNDAGREVPQILFNLQSLDNGGDGLIQLWEFPAEGDRAHITVFDTIHGRKYAGDNTEFEFTYR